MYTEQDLSKLIGEVEKEFTAHLAKAEEEQNSALTKSEEVKEESTDQSTETVKAEENVENIEESLVKAEEEKEEDKEEKCDYDEKDMEEMHKMYSSMSKGERKAHMEMLSKCGEMTMQKSEDKQVEAQVTAETPAPVANPETDLLKSEIDGLKAKNEELKKNLDAVSEFLTKFVKKTAPQGKAITNLDAIAKSEAKEEEKTLSKGEITAILAKKAADPALSKSDREAINAFYLSKTNISTINHLLK